MQWPIAGLWGNDYEPRFLKRLRQGARKGSSVVA
jgi:hypothetical protein